MTDAEIEAIISELQDRVAATPVLDRPRSFEQRLLDAITEMFDAIGDLRQGVDRDA